MSDTHKCSSRILCKIFGPRLISLQIPSDFDLKWKQKIRSYSQILVLAAAAVVQYLERTRSNDAITDILISAKSYDDDRAWATTTTNPTTTNDSNHFTDGPANVQSSKWVRRSNETCPVKKYWLKDVVFIGVCNRTKEFLSISWTQCALSVFGESWTVCHLIGNPNATPYPVVLLWRRIRGTARPLFNEGYGTIRILGPVLQAPS